MCLSSLLLHFFGVSAWSIEPGGHIFLGKIAAILESQLELAGLGDLRSQDDPLIGGELGFELIFRQPRQLQQESIIIVLALLLHGRV